MILASIQMGKLIIWDDLYAFDTSQGYVKRERAEDDGFQEKMMHHSSS